jgi:5-amino-6-(5-phospho-D-ribitylamino)uracil phosphatase
MVRKENKKLIVCDLDGTLLNSNSELSERSIQTVKKIIDEGNLFCIATGRPKRGALDFYNKLGLDTVMVNINGSYICKPNEPNFTPINLTYCKEIAKEIINNPEINLCATNIVIETADREYILRKPHDIEVEKKILDVFHVDLNKKDEFKYLNKIDNLDLDVNSILIIMRSETDVTKIRKIIKTISKTLVVRS